MFKDPNKLATVVVAGQKAVLFLPEPTDQDEDDTITVKVFFI